MYSEIEKKAREEFKVLQAVRETHEAERRMKDAFGGLDMGMVTSVLKELEEREKLEKLYRPLAKQMEYRALEQAFEHRGLLKSMYEQPTVPVVYDYVGARNQASAKKLTEIIRAEVNAEVTRRFPEQAEGSPTED